jgi:hypothetical protein
MARPTAGTLTGAGFAQVGTSSKYSKNAGSTAKSSVDIGNNTANTGVSAVEQQGSGYITTADFNTALANHVTVGSQPATGTPTSVDTGRNLVYYGITI